MKAMPLLLSMCMAIAVIVMAVAYFLVPSKIIERKSEYVKFALVFLSIYLALFSAVYTILFGQITVDEAFTLLVSWFFPSLFLSYGLYKFRTVKKNQHVGFFLFWAALCSLPPGLGVLYVLCF